MSDSTPADCSGSGRRRLNRISVIAQLLDQIGNLAGSRAVRRVFLDRLGLEHRFGEGDALGDFGFPHGQGQIEQAQFAPEDCGINRID